MRTHEEEASVLPAWVALALWVRAMVQRLLQGRGCGLPGDVGHTWLHSAFLPFWGFGTRQAGTGPQGLP